MDGINEINCYSQGKTWLGRQLTNFAKTPFELDGMKFQSVEGWWYWRQSKDPRLFQLSGFAAKKLGKELRKEGPPPTREELKRVYEAKLLANPELIKAIISSTLPFDHYYEFNGKRVETHWKWTGQLWNEIRDSLKREIGTNSK